MNHLDTGVGPSQPPFLSVPGLAAGYQALPAGGSMGRCLPAHEGGGALVNKIKLVAPLVLIAVLALIALLLPRLVARIQAAVNACKSGSTLMNRDTDREVGEQLEATD